MNIIERGDPLQAVPSQQSWGEAGKLLSPLVRVKVTSAWPATAVFGEMEVSVIPAPVASDAQRERKAKRVRRRRTIGYPE